MNKPKALFIVEGEAAEKKTVNALVRCLGEISNLNNVFVYKICSK